MAQKAINSTDAPARGKRLFFTGFTMGLADLVPGVSGGTIALLFGIYDELLYSIKLVTGKVLKLLFARKFKQAFRLIPFAFLLPVGIGIGLAIFGMVQVVSYLLDTQPVAVWSLFFGLVVGSVVVVSRRVLHWTIGRILLLILGFIITFLLVGLPSLGGSSAPLAVLGSGAVAITAMILPGISGSLILVLLGQYETIIHAVAERDYVLIGLFAIGAVVGLALFVRLLTWLLKRYHFAVIATLVGVMAGSLRRVWPWQTEHASGAVSTALPPFDYSLLLAIVLAAVGFSLVLVLERSGIAKEHDDIQTRDFKKEFKQIEQ